MAHNPLPPSQRGRQSDQAPQPVPTWHPDLCPEYRSPEYGTSRTCAETSRDDNDRADAVKHYSPRNLLLQTEKMSTSPAKARSYANHKHAGKPREFTCRGTVEK
jgi:hypothetical protein